MQATYSYWLFKDVLTKEDRKKIKRVASKVGYENASTRGKTWSGKDSTDTARVQDVEIRDTEVSWSDDQFLYDILCPFVHNANEQAGWKYDLDWFESVQIAKYKKNQHYSWHTDGAGDHFGAYTEGGDNIEGKVRKVSCVSILSNGYTGGDFELALQKQDGENLILRPEMEVGDVIVFPSYVFHRSTPISKGTKYSAAMWCLGPPFR